MKEDKNTKIKPDKKDKKIKSEKTEKNNKFIETLKKKWLIDTSKTAVLVIIILAFFVGVSILMEKLSLTPIDLTEEKLFSLTQESKDQVKNIDKDVTIYFIGFTEEDSVLDLAKQYTKANEKIKIEVVNVTERPDLVQKYGIEKDSQGIIVASENNSKVLSSNDLYTYDTQTYESINVAEEKLTAAIKTVIIDKLPKVYFLTGYSEITLESGMQYFDMYLHNEIIEEAELNILTTGKVPDDCNTLVIPSPNKDFDDITTNAIKEYINKGGNILWLNSALAKKIELTNVNSILAIYGVNPFEVGIIRETDTSKMVTGLPDIILPEILYADVTNKVYGGPGVIMVNATKINTLDDDKLEEISVTKTPLVQTSKGAYFRVNFNNQSDNPSADELKAEYLIGAQFDKKISEETTSKLIIYGENYFVSDSVLTQSSATPLVAYANNKDLVLNSIAYLADREEDIAVRKSTGRVTYTATEQENRIILSIIIAVPLIIIAVGIIVWIKRRRQK